jgi:cytochrome c-type biogenesis protein CcmH
MIDWFLMAVMTGAAVMAVLWPLSRRSAIVPDTATDTAFYTAQLAEIARDLDRSLIGPAEAEAARIEAGRRLLQVAHAQPASKQNASPRLSRTRMRVAALLALVMVPVVAGALYLRLGHPGQPDMPLAQRIAAPSHQDFAALVARVEQRLADHPEDIAGWQVIAPVYMAGERYEDAARAYATIIRLLGAKTSPDLYASYAEALIAQAGGVVTADARQALDRALAADPTLPSARYYRALAAEQDGRDAEALQGFRALLADLPPQAPATEAVRQRIARLDGRATVPTGGEAIAALPEAERLATIRAMVDGLEQKLMQSGGDAEAWTRLIRSLAVLKDEDRARRALMEARRSLAGDEAALARIEAVASESGVR